MNAEVRTQAQAQADLLAATAADLLARTDRGELATLADTGAQSIRGRVLVVDRRGAVLADSSGSAQLGASYAARPEIATALRGHQIQLSRSSVTLGEQILATAVPIVRNDQTVGAVRVTQSVAAVQDAIGRAELGLALIAVIVLALGLAVGTLIARQVAGPVLRLQQVARRVAQGDLTARAALDGSREQRSLGESFNEMTGRISRLLEAQREFVADASHQLRTPLTGLRLRLEAARFEIADTPAASELDAALAEVDRLAETVQELLVLSRGGERRAEGAWVDLGDLATATVERWQARAQERSMTLERRVEARASSVWAARADLERALDALVENALGYGPIGSRVVVTAGLGAITVRDHGPGIAEDELELVFERFHRGRAGRGGPPGSGLGLPIARELARAWGGDVSLGNAQGGGAIATLSIPAASAGSNVASNETLTSLNPPGTSVRSP
ncbi:MAG: ATP-binding protein [Solirubrobacteraceae bacterium]